MLLVTLATTETPAERFRRLTTQLRYREPDALRTIAQDMGLEVYRVGSAGPDFRKPIAWTLPQLMALHFLAWRMTRRPPR